MGYFQVFICYGMALRLFKSSDLDTYVIVIALGKENTNFNIVIFLLFQQLHVQCKKLYHLINHHNNIFYKDIL